MDELTKEDLIVGSGNPYADVGLDDAPLRLLKATLGIEIMKTLRERGLSTADAHAITGVNKADFSRIRNARFSRFTVDRLTLILSKLDRDVDFKVDVHERTKEFA